MLQAPTLGGNGIGVWKEISEVWQEMTETKKNKKKKAIICEIDAIEHFD